MKLAAIAASLLVSCPLARAGGLEPKDLPADARWVTHVDLEALDRSAFVAALAERGQDITKDFDLDRLQSAFGVDPRKDLTSLTFYGPSKGESEYVVIVRGRLSAERPWSRVVEASRAVRELGTRNLYATAGRTSFVATRVDPERHDFVFATSESALIAAVAVLDGNAASARSELPGGMRLDPSPGAIVFATGTGKSWKSPFLRRGLQLLDELAGFDEHEEKGVGLAARGLTFEFAEAHGDIDVRLELETPGAKEVAEVAGILRTALGRVPKLAAGTDAIPQVERLTRALRIDVRGARARASYRYGAVAFVSDVLSAEKLMGVARR